MTSNSCIGYCRVSTDKQGKYGTSLHEQEARIIQFCSVNNLELIKIFVEDESGTIFRTRPILNLALKYCQENDIHTWVSTKYDRLTRANLKETYWFKERLDELKIKFIPCEEYVNKDDSPEGEFIEGIMEAKARYVRNDIVRQVSRGMVRRVEDDSRWVFGKPPLGYKKEDVASKISRKCVPDEPAYSIIKKCWSYVLSGNYTMMQTYHLAKEMGLKTRSGKMISKQTFCTIVRNPFYAGYIVAKTRKAKYADFNIDKEGEWIEYAMITLDEFKAAQAILNERKKNRQMKMSKINTNFALAKIIRCHECGKLMTGSYAKRKHNLYYYRCVPCKVSGNGRELDATFYKFLKKCSPTDQMVNDLTEILKRKYAEKYKDQDRLKAQYESDILSLTNKKIKAKEGFLNGIYSDTEAKELIAKIELDLALSNSLLAKCTVDNSRMQELVEYGLKYLQHLDTFWDKASGNTRMQLGKVLFPKGLIYKEGHFYNLQKSLMARHILGLRQMIVSDGGPNWTVIQLLMRVGSIHI